MGLESGWGVPAGVPSSQLPPTRSGAPPHPPGALSQESPETRPPFVPLSLARAPTQLEGCRVVPSHTGAGRNKRVRKSGLPTGSLGDITGGRSLERTPTRTRPPHRSRPEPSGPGRGGRRLKSPAAGHLDAGGRNIRKRKGLLDGSGEWKEENPSEGVERATQPGKARTKDVQGGEQCGRMETELDHWHRGGGGGWTTLWTGKSGEGLSRARGDGAEQLGGVPERPGRRFPGSEPPSPPPGPAGWGRATGAAGGLTRPLASGEGPLPARRASRPGRVGADEGEAE